MRLISTNRTHYPDIPGLVNFKSLILSIVRKITLIDLAGYPVCGTSTEILISALDSWVTAVTQRRNNARGPCVVTRCAVKLRLRGRCSVAA